ncbi:hypothetical protein [Flavobacterium sp. N502540]|uniref:hypothetical protein n=1 Tax=Flavobacterium sp. N502540 TaxID=2986838 RepID=UPI0022253A86|nr:hypothetical protein [Flavobacterium sp. N502540]
MKQLLFFIFLLASAFSFGQAEEVQKTEIEGGTLSKKYIDGKLESFIVEMYAVNYGNIFSFTKGKDTITVSNGEKSAAVIKIYFKDQMQISELFYKKKIVGYLEAINLNIDQLPKSNSIYSFLVNNKIKSSICSFDLNDLDENFDQNLIKLFTSLNHAANAENLDSAFNSIAHFFSKEDALYRIYLASYAEKFAPPIITYLKTNESGKIESGIVWTGKETGNGKYEIYSKEKVIQSGIQNLSNFKETFREYFSKIENID